MIILKYLRANNFKSLCSVHLLFPERGSVLIEGQNEAGKSTLFEAVYVAVYGKPLVGEETVARQDEVIQHGQTSAIVQLAFSVGQQALTVTRHFERGKAQQATLKIQRPGTPEEVIQRARAVNDRVLKELGNLDGDSLRNSCFVEQKELGRIETLSLDQRKQAIQKLLGLERLTQLMEQFKFRREQERELILAQSYLRLAELQAEVRTASAKESERLDTIEQVELPRARAYLNDVRSAAEAVAQSVQARKRVQEAQEACREAERSVKALELAEAGQQQKEDDLTRAQERVVQRHKEAEVEQQRFIQQLKELEAKRLRLEDAFTSVKKWEAANGVLQALREEISATEAKEQALLKLQMEMRQQEDEVRNLEGAVARAEQEMQQAANAVRLAMVYEALTTWVRLKGVEMVLGGYTTQQSELLTKYQEAETALATARTKLRTPLFVGIVLAVLAVLALILGILWLPAFALLVIFLGGAIAAWLWFFRTRKGVQKRFDSLAQCRLELQRLDMQRQAAIQAGGDPVGLAQYEQQLQAAGFAVPSSLGDGRIIQEELHKRLGTLPGHHTLQEAAQIARDNHVRLFEQLRQVRSTTEGIEQELYLAQQSGNPAEQLIQLKTQAAVQEKIAATDEEVARQSLTGYAQWPTDSTALQTLLSTCQIELHNTDEAQKRQEQTSARLIQEAGADETKAEHSLQQAREIVATLKVSDPAAQLSRAQENLAEIETICHQREEAARPLLSKIHLQVETEVETVRGRAEARKQALEEEELTARPQQQEKYKTCKANLTNSLTTTSAQIGDLLAELNNLAITGLPSLPQLINDDDISFRYEDELTATLNGIRKALQTTLNMIDEQGTRKKLDDTLGDQGRTEHQKDIVETAKNSSQQVIDAIFSMRGIVHPSSYRYDSILIYWPLLERVSSDEESQVTENLEEVRRRLYAARQQESLLATELHHPGTPLNIEECQQKVTELVEEREISGWATQLLRETHDRIARRVLPITERNKQPLLQQLTGGRYRDVRLTPEDKDGQPEEMDYRIRVWDPAAGRYVAKNLFSGGTRDQCSLALRLAFALATLPQELGVAPGFIFLDEPLSAFDSLRAQALVVLITTGTIAQQFNQVILISHQHAFDREAFQYHVRMDSGQIVESDLPHSEDSDVEPIQLQPASASSG